MKTQFVKTWSSQAATMRLGSVTALATRITNSLRTRITGKTWIFAAVLAILCVALPSSAFAEHAMDVGSDGRTRLLWTRTDGRISIWVLDAALNVVLSREHGSSFGWIPQAIGVGSDGVTRVLWKSTDGRMSIWLLDANLSLVLSRSYGPFIGWTPQTISVGNDNRTRVLWKNTDGHISVWVLDGALNAGLIREHRTLAGWETRSMSELTPPATAAQ